KSREKIGIVHNLMRIRHAFRIRHKLFKKEKDQIFSNHHINHVWLVSVYVIRVRQSILFIFRMNLENIFCGGKVGESIKENNQCHYKTSQWTGNTDVKIHPKRCYPLTQPDDRTHRADRKRNGWHRNIIGQTGGYIIFLRCEVMPKFMNRKNKQKRNRKMQTTPKVSPCE